MQMNTSIHVLKGLLAGAADLDSVTSQHALDPDHVKLLVGDSRPGQLTFDGLYGRLAGSRNPSENLSGSWGVPGRSLGLLGVFLGSPGFPLVVV